MFITGWFRNVRIYIRNVLKPIDIDSVPPESLCKILYSTREEPAKSNRRQLHIQWMNYALSLHKEVLPFCKVKVPIPWNRC